MNRTLALNHDSDSDDESLSSAHGCDDGTVCGDAFYNVCHGGRNSDGAGSFSGGGDTWAGGNNSVRSDDHGVPGEPHVAAAGAEPTADGVQGKGCAGR